MTWLKSQSLDLPNRRERTSFVWGGCMLFPAEALRSGTHGILQVLATWTECPSDVPIISWRQCCRAYSSCQRS
jgi:hypothetical protein